MTELINGDLGPESKYDLKIVAGKLLAVVEYKGAQLDGSLNLKLDLGAILDIIKAKIPGSVDDVIFDVLKAALNAQSDDVATPQLAGK